MEKIHYFRPLYLALALTISLFSTASTPNRYKTSASLPDSLLTEQHIRSIYYTLPDSALSLLDEAEARRLPHLPQFRIDMLRGTVYERQGMYHLKERYIRRALQSDSVQHTPLRKLQVLTQLATALDRLNKYEEGIRICTEAIELAQEQGQKAKESELLFTLGRMYQGMKLDDKAFRTCRLGGIHASILLHNGQCGEKMITQEFSIGNPTFHEGSFTDGTLTGEICVFGFDEETDHSMSLSANLVDGKTKIEQNFDKVSISKDTDETGAIYLHIEAKTPGRIPDVEPEKDPNSGFNADVNDWGKEENTELPL